MVQIGDVGVKKCGTFWISDFSKGPPPFGQKVALVLFGFRTFRRDPPKSSKKYRWYFLDFEFFGGDHPHQIGTFWKFSKTPEKKFNGDKFEKKITKLV